MRPNNGNLVINATRPAVQRFVLFDVVTPVDPRDDVCNYQPAVRHDFLGVPVIGLHL